MFIMNCYDDVAGIVIDEASKRFSPLWEINPENLNIFKNYCDAIDSISKEFDGESFEVEVDEITMEITIVLECFEVLIHTKKHLFYELIKRSVRFGFSTSEDGNLLVKFVFPSLWDRV